MTDTDQDLYKNFPLVISERWQQEVAETVFDTVNQEADKLELKKKSKQKAKFNQDEKGDLLRHFMPCLNRLRVRLTVPLDYLGVYQESDCIIHGYIKKLGGPFASAWQTRYAKLYPNRLELHTESGSTKPEASVLCTIIFSFSFFTSYVRVSMD